MSDLFERAARELLLEPPTPGLTIDEIRDRAQDRHRRRAILAGAWCLVAIISGLLVLTDVRSTDDNAPANTSDTSTPLVVVPDAMKDFYPHVEQTIALLRGDSVLFVAECMTLHGFPSFVPATRPDGEPRVYEPAWWRTPDIELASTAGLGYTLFSGPIAFGAVQLADVYDPPEPSSTPLSESEQIQQNDACERTFAAAPRFELDENGLAPAYSDLLATFYETTLAPGFEAIQRQLDACLHDRGVAYGPEGLYQYTEDQVLTIIGNLTSDDRAIESKVRHALRVETAISVSEVQCRSEQADQVAVILSPVFETWLTEHPDLDI